MPDIKQDEFNFNPELCEDHIPQELTYADEFISGGEEILYPPEIQSKAVEFGQITAPRAEKAEKEEKTPSRSRFELAKKLFLVPVAASVASLSIVFASMSFDPLGTDFLNTLSPAIETEAPASSTPSGTSSPTTPTETKEKWMPVLTNLAPDTTGVPTNEGYALAGYPGYNNKSEAYIMLIGSSATYNIYLGDGHKAYMSENSVAGVSYDLSSNTLTLNNFNSASALGEEVRLQTNLLGNGFKINLVGNNSLGSAEIYGWFYGGSVTFTGSGSLTLNKGLNFGNGLIVFAEQSGSCVMIENGPKVECFAQTGNSAVVVSGTAFSEKGIYYPSSVGMTGDGSDPTETRTSLGTSSDGTEYYDYTLADPTGAAADHVVFAPKD